MKMIYTHCSMDYNLLQWIKTNLMKIWIQPKMNLNDNY